MFSIWPKNQPKTTEIIFSRYFHFKAFPPLSHTHESLTHALPLSSLHCSDPHTEPNGTTHTDAPRSKLDAAKLRSTPHRRSSNDPSSDPLHTGNETSSDPLQALDENRSDPLHAVDETSSDPQTSSDPLHPLEGVQGSSRLINTLFWLISHFWKILWSDLELGGSIFSASVCCFSLFCTLGQCLFFLILLFFLQNFSSNITRDACWCFFFFFWIFVSI